MTQHNPTNGTQTTIKTPRRVVVVAVVVVVVVVWDTVECVCMYTPHNARMQELTADYTHADLETCPGIILLQSWDEQD